jgi:SET domain-containing protein
MPQRAFFIAPSITVKSFPGKGRGVVATRPIAAGETVECSPMLLCPAASIPEQGHPISDYVYGYGDELALCLGYASLYNHSRNPNCTWDFDEDLPAIIIFATRPIGADEELTLDYGIPLWFREA